MTEPSEESSAAPATTDSRKKNFWAKVSGSLEDIWEQAYDHYSYEEIRGYLRYYPDLMDSFDSWFMEWNDE